MKLAVIYSDKRGKYIANGFRKFCDVVAIDLSAVALSPLQKILSALLSCHLKRSDWVIDFYRNPFSVTFRKNNGNKILCNLDKQVDAILQFGVMNTYDYSLLGTNKIFYYHDGAYDKNSKLWTIKRFKNWFPLMQKRAFNRATAIFTFSEWARQQHINEYEQNEKKVFSVGWGPCLPVENDQIDLKIQAKKLLFIGRPDKWKGLDLLFAAFKKVKKKYPDIVLDIVGVDAQEVHLTNSQGIFFHGRVAQNDVLNFLQRADLFILPSLYERSAHVIVEAMWYGCPVIISDTCGSPEPVIAGQCGLVVPTGNEEKLEQAILILIEHPENVPQLSRNAMLEARKNWSWNSVCGRMIEHMEAAINVEK